MSIRKIKRRAMRRMAWPVVSLRLPMAMFAGMTTIQRDQLIGKALNQYLKEHP